MRKFIVFLGTVCVFAACNSGDDAQKQTTADTSASSSADSIKNAVENSLKDTVLNPTDSIKPVDTLRK